MAVATDGKALLESMRRRRGYVLPMHEVLAERDPDFLAAYDAYFSSVMREDSPLPRKVREFVLMGLTLALGSPEPVVAGHARRAREHGATEEEILAVVELASLAFTSRGLGAGVAAAFPRGQG
jgi:alkylhydroperoxidase/carboxymuconolactone decarboxylase family protein YurZ